MYVNTILSDFMNKERPFRTELTGDRHKVTTRGLSTRFLLYLLCLMGSIVSVHL